MVPALPGLRLLTTTSPTVVMTVSSEHGWRVVNSSNVSFTTTDLFSAIMTDAVSVMKRVLARAAGGVKVDYVHVSITAGMKL